jgi:hypothetical protein
MIARPTTEQILLDCARELMEGVLPNVTDQTTIVRIVLLEQVLRNAAVRTAHEIQWMSEEIPAVASYGRAVADVAPSSELEEAIRRLEEVAGDQRLDLVVVVERYCRAGEVLAAALQAAIAAGRDDLRKEGERLLDGRLTREEEVMAGWSPAGR